MTRLGSVALVVALTLAPGVGRLEAQEWCVPMKARPYSPNMPGITQVSLGAVSRHSASVESTVNSYSLSEQEAILVAGRLYEIGITHTRDTVLFPTVRNNIRVWIDFNKNGSFADPGEAVVTADRVVAGASTFSFTVPAEASEVSQTRMRVTAKMSAEGGHSPPTPCDDPPDPIEYHGEIEDYLISIRRP